MLFGYVSSFEVDNLYHMVLLIKILRQTNHFTEGSYTVGMILVASQTHKNNVCKNI